MSLSLDRLKLLRRQAGQGTSRASGSPAGSEVTSKRETGHNETATAAALSSSPHETSGHASSTADGLPPCDSDATALVSKRSPLAVTASMQVTRNAPAREASVFAWIEQSPPSSAGTSAREVGKDVVPARSIDAATKPTQAAVGMLARKATQRAPVAAARGAQNVDSLRRLLQMRERRVGQGRAASTPVGPIDRDLPGDEIAPGLRLIEAFLPQAVPTAALSLAFARREDEAVDPRKLLFFDTETTGLAGGTGTRAFMIGAADWHTDPQRGDGLRVRQLVMATMGAETEMLREFARWLDTDTVLSSYNGRCYDAPLLKTRYRLARLADPLSALDHVDLLFPTRRRYRGTWENCRLATIERQLLHIVREDDLPGSEAPAAWLGYLRGGSARNLRRVGEHNHQDVVTLAQLFQRLVMAEEEQHVDPAPGIDALPSSL